MQTEASWLVNVSHFGDAARRLRDAHLAVRFAFRQGLWIEDLRIPPGQECSNGSLILLAVVLWRAFSSRGADRRHGEPLSYEAAQDEDGTLFTGC
jgi:hypothetical protein